MHEMDLSGEFSIGDGTDVLVQKGDSGLIKGEVLTLKGESEEGCPTTPSEIEIVKTENMGPGWVGIKSLSSDKSESRKMQIGVIKKCYEKSVESTSSDEDPVLGECGEMPMGAGSAMLPAAALSKKMGVHQGDRRRVAPHDQEGRSAKEQLNKIAKYAVELMEKLHDDDELESWIQAKITKAASYMSAAKHHLEYEYENPAVMDEYAPMMESSKKKVDNIIGEVAKLKKKHSLISESLNLHRLGNVPVTDSFFEVGSEPYINLIAEAKKLWKNGLYEPTKDEKRIFETNLGEWGIYNGRKVPLDCSLGKSKKRHTYVKNKQGKIIKVPSSKNK